MVRGRIASGGERGASGALTFIMIFKLLKIRIFHNFVACLCGRDRKTQASTACKTTKIMKHFLLGLLLALVCVTAVSSKTRHSRKSQQHQTADTIKIEGQVVEILPSGEIHRLTEQDYIEVARALDVEVAAVKAIVDIEAGRAHEGFSAPGVPLINFDYSMFSRFASKKGINLSKYRKSHPLVFSSHGRGSQAAVNRRLNAARSINNRAAIEGTFWGMFQIGGFNWKLCGCKDIDEFVEKMSRSERDQLELFAHLVTNTGMVKHLRNKNWAAFARIYNGPSYAARGYHTRLAAAYNRHRSSGK